MVRIYFVIMFITVMLSFGCSEDRDTQPLNNEEAVETKKIVAAGDSLTAGYGVAQSENFPHRLGEKLKENGFNYTVINAGVSGETSSGALSRIKWILSRKPDIVILETGANDGRRGIPVPVIRENLSRAVQMLHEADVTVVLAGMQIVQNLGQEYTSEFADIYPAVAGEQKCILIPFFLQDVAGEPLLNQADTIHPNEEGHKILSETVYPFIVQAIQNFP